MATQARCPACGAPVPGGTGAAECPQCGAALGPGRPGGLTLPPPGAGAQAQVYCWKCGTANAAGAGRCSHCGEAIYRGPAADAFEGSGLERLIPLRNPLAIWGYYCGIFSLIPCLGSPLGLAAVILGSMGYRRYRANPAGRGLTHSLTALILGTLSLLMHGLFILFVASGGP